MKKIKGFRWGIKMSFFVLLFSIVLFPISPSVSLDPEGKPLYEIENLDASPTMTDLQLSISEIEEELNSEAISGIAASAATIPPLATPIELY